MVLAASKSVLIFSEDGAGCDDLNASPPEEPALPAAIPGACIQYMISLENTGPIAAQNVTLVDELPPPLILQAGELGENRGKDTALTTPGCPGSDCKLRIEDGVIGAGESAILVIRATIDCPCLAIAPIFRIPVAGISGLSWTLPESCPIRNRRVV
jgi:uncharacterized repeat protein (TIGR01451 family)